MKRPDAIERFAVGVIKQLQASLGLETAGQKDGPYYQGVLF